MTAGKPKLPRPLVDTPGQQRINWSRAAQLSALDRFVAPRVPKVSGCMLKGVLRALDSFCRGTWGFPSQSTLAVASGLDSEDQVRRVLKALEGLSLICKERRKPVGSKGRYTCNHYLIVWSEVGLLCPDMEADQPDMEADQPDMEADQPDMEADQPDMEAVSTGPGCPVPITALSAIEPPPPTPSKLPDTSQAGRDDGWAAAVAAIKATGIDHVDSVWRTAKQMEYTPDEVLHICDTWSANRHLFTKVSREGGVPGVGALLYRIRHRVWPASGVQDPQVIREARARQEEARRKREADARREMAESEASRAELQALEVAYGSELDALDEAQLDELARATFRSDFEWTRFRRNRQSCRYELLVAIHANRGRPPGGDPRPVRVGKTMVRDGRLLLIDTEGR